MEQSRDELKKKLRNKIDAKKATRTSVRSQDKAQKSTKDDMQIASLASELRKGNCDTVLDQLQVTDPAMREAVKSMIAAQAIDTQTLAHMMNSSEPRPATAEPSVAVEENTLPEAPPPSTNF